MADWLSWSVVLTALTAIVAFIVTIPPGGEQPKGVTEEISLLRRLKKKRNVIVGVFGILVTCLSGVESQRNDGRRTIEAARNEKEKSALLRQLNEKSDQVLTAQQELYVLLRELNKRIEQISDLKEQKTALNKDLQDRLDPCAAITVLRSELEPTSVTGRDPVSGSIYGDWRSEPGSQQAEWYGVAGFRDDSGKWVGGVPVVIDGMQGKTLALWPGQPFSACRFEGLLAPESAGTYTVWVQMVPVASPAGAVEAFKRPIRTAPSQYNVPLGTITVTPHRMGETRPTNK